MARVFSGIQPSGDLHLGNLLGALVNWVKHQDEHDAVYCVVDLHALTLQNDPAELREATLELAQLLMAIGIDPERSILFVQSQVTRTSPAGLADGMHRELWRAQPDDGVQGQSRPKRLHFSGLFTYPALQAADILLYDTDLVPVGDDQRQHIEITRDIAERFNSRYGETFVVPEHVIPPSELA